MSQPPPSWDLFTAFAAVMRTRSLSAAARELGTAQPTVRRQVASLEAALGVALFTRSPAGLTPTDAATRLLPHAQEMAASAAAAIRAASGLASADAGTVRITSSEVVGTEILPGLLAPLMAAHPGLVIELAPTNRTEDLLRRDADIALRMVRPTQVGLLARLLGEIEIGLFAHRSYLARLPSPASMADLGGHSLIGEEHPGPLAQAIATIKGAPPDLAFTWRSDSDLAQLAALRAGIGIGVCQAPIAAREGLIRVLPEVALALPVWLAMHEDLRAVPIMRLVFDHLAATWRLGQSHA